jgi:rRNA maturation endonuclease Nob1
LAFFGVEKKKKQECQIVCFWCVAVVQFARATGDLQALSEVDLKLIALAYTLETQAHGTSHLRSKPPPLQVYFSLH